VINLLLSDFLHRLAHKVEARCNNARSSALLQCLLLRNYYQCMTLFHWGQSSAHFLYRSQPCRASRTPATTTENLRPSNRIVPNRSASCGARRTSGSQRDSWPRRPEWSSSAQRELCFVGRWGPPVGLVGSVPLSRPRSVHAINGRGTAVHGRRTQQASFPSSYRRSSGNGSCQQQLMEISRCTWSLWG
jgi:hypothetical protein